MVLGVITLALGCPFNIFSAAPQKPVKPVHRPISPVREMPDTINLSPSTPDSALIVGERFSLTGDSVTFTPVDTLAILPNGEPALFTDSIAPAAIPAGKTREFNPDPIRAVWLSALFPGLGQIYNRRFWKLPILVGGFMGLGYGASWNNNMLSDYSRAYSDIMDNDPNTKSYMDFFPPTTNEADINKEWLKRTLKSRKDYFRRNRDLCIISMVGVYALAIVDAYVDASLSQFDISPDLSINVAPTILPDINGNRPAFGVLWALNF